MKYYINEEAGTAAAFAAGNPPAGSKKVTKRKYNNFLKKQEGLKATAAKKKQDRALKKLNAFEYMGVFCSVTGRDQNGLLTVFMSMDKGLMTKTKFQFSNGNVLELSSGSIGDFMAIWTEHRQQYFE